MILASLGEAIRGIHEYLQGMTIEEEMSTLRFRMGMGEVENASLRGKIRTMEAIEMVTRSQERRTLMILASLGEAIRGIHEYLQGVTIEEEMSTLRFRMGMDEVENASLCGKIRTMEAIEMVTRSQERRTRREME
nr:hypothetical protein [Tanacetum cinerariifolium]